MKLKMLLKKNISIEALNTISETIHNKAYAIMSFKRQRA